MAGRWLAPADQVPRVPERVMLSYGYWQRRFGGARSAIGRALTVDSRPQEIVNVMPKGFRIVNADFDAARSVQFDRGQLILAGFGLNGIARLKPGMNMAQANADLTRMLPIWMDSWTNGPGTGSGRYYANWKITPAIRLLKKEVVGAVSDVLWVVMATIGLVMLIACANVANLLLVRADVRQQEMAIRSALGASRARVVGSLLVESLMLGLMGGVLGAGLAAAGLRLLQAIGPEKLPRLSEISIDLRKLAFALALSALSGLLFGLIPALKYAGPRISAMLRAAGRTASLSRERHRVRNVLVVVQVAMALVLLVSAGLMIRTFQTLRTVDPGFTDAGHLETMRIAIPPTLVAEPERVLRIQNEIVDKLAAIPGVTAAGLGSEMPMEQYGSNWDSIDAEGRTYSPGEIPPLRFYKYVSPGFLHAAGTRMIAGRELTWSEVYGRRPVAMLSENLARELWGSAAAALGRHIRHSNGDPWSKVVGVVQDVHETSIDQKAPAVVYWPSLLNGPGWNDVIRTMTFVIRSQRAGTESFLNQVRQAVWSVNGTEQRPVES